MRKVGVIMGLDQYLSGKNSNGSLTEVAYWRKANAIHAWFVDNVQDGIDECEESPVSREKLNELLSLCRKIKSTANLVDGHVYNGSHVGADTNGEWVDDYIEGKVIENPEILEKLLPTREGFFFGSTAYDQYYLQDIDSTIAQLEAALTLEFKEFVYQSSW